jgi:hypothetical protein
MSDYAGRTYEFVPKSELNPVKDQVEVIINALQDSMRVFGVTFTFKLVGSGGKHLVTRVVNGNTGFDFDYNLGIQKEGDLSAKDLRLKVKRELERILQGTGYSTVSSGKQSMTFKFIDHDNSRIVHSCDFALVNDYVDDVGDSIQEILIWQREDDTYIWNKRPYAKNHSDKLSNLKANGLWQEVKDEYLKIKNNNQDREKKSFSLFFEAINNVYNRYDWN